MVSISEELIERMARRIVREVDPERIVLFGSWARGEANEQSDVDFLIVEREPFGPNRSRREEAVRIWQCLYEFRVPKDILVYSVGEIDQWKDSNYHVVGSEDLADFDRFAQLANRLLAHVQSLLAIG